MNTAAKAATDALHAHIKDKGIGSNPDAVRSLVDALWAVAHDETIDDKEMSMSLAYLSGIACATLIDYAAMLDDDRVQIIAEN